MILDKSKFPSKLHCFESKTSPLPCKGVVPALESLLACALWVLLSGVQGAGNMPLGQWLSAGITGSSSLGVLFLRITRLLRT